MGIDLGKSGFSRTLRAQVVHTAPHIENLWFVGCEFVERLTDEELHSFL